MSVGSPIGNESNAPRRKRFSRGTAPALRLTGDDAAIILHVAKHRFLNSRHIIGLMPHRSAKKLIERLGVLYHNGFLDRPRAQLTYYAAAGSAPMVYALGNCGAHVLAERTEFKSPRVDWTWKNRSIGRLFLEHTLMTADVMVGLACHVRQRTGITLIEPQQIAATALNQKRTPFSFTARPQGFSMELTVVPDCVFGLDIDGQRSAKYFFLEADRATMPVVRSDLNQTSMMRKFLAYVAGGGSQNAFGKQLGINNFRVLVVTTSTQRMTTMIEALKMATGGVGSRQFLFADHEAVRRAENLLDLEWLTGKGEHVRLIN